MATLTHKTLWKESSPLIKKVRSARKKNVTITLVINGMVAHARYTAPRPGIRDQAEALIRE